MMRATSASNSACSSAGPVFEVLVHMAQLVFHRPHAVDRALDDARRDAALQQHEAAADARDVRLGRVGGDVVAADEQVLALHAVGARAFHARKLGAGLERHARRVAAQHEHHLAHGLAAAVDHRRDGAEVVVGPEVADPGQGAVDEVAAVDRRGLEQQALDLREALHRVREAGAAQRLAAHMARQPLARQRRVARGLHVQPRHALAPHHEAGGAADLGRLRHRQDGLAVVAGRTVGVRQVGAHRPRAASRFISATG
jgi:hypothetical protein